MSGGRRGEDTLGGGRTTSLLREEPMRGRVVGAGCQSPRTDQISCEQLPRRSRSLARSRVAPPPELKLDRPSEKSGRDAEEQEEERGPGCGKPGRGSPSAACCFCSSSGAVSVGRENFWLIFFNFIAVED